MGEVEESVDFEQIFVSPLTHIYIFLCMKVVLVLIIFVGILIRNLYFKHKLRMRGRESIKCLLLLITRNASLLHKQLTCTVLVLFPSYSISTFIADLFCNISRSRTQEPVTNVSNLLIQNQ